MWNGPKGGGGAAKECGWHECGDRHQTSLYSWEIGHSEVAETLIIITGQVNGVPAEGETAIVCPGVCKLVKLPK